MPESTPHPHGYGRCCRLTQRSAFKRVFDQGRRWVGRAVILWVYPEGAGGLRVGVAAGKKMGCAPERNRMKRRMREAVRLLRNDWRGSASVVVMARQDALTLPWPALRDELSTLARKAGLQQECNG